MDKHRIDVEFDRAVGRAKTLARRADGTIDEYKYGLLFVAAMVAATKVYGARAAGTTASRYLTPDNRIRIGR